MGRFHPRGARRQSSDSLIRVHRHRPVGVSLLQRDAYQAVGALVQALLCHGRAKHVILRTTVPPSRCIQGALPSRALGVERMHRRHGDAREAVEQRAILGQLLVADFPLYGRSLSPILGDRPRRRRLWCTLYT